MRRDFDVYSLCVNLERGVRIPPAAISTMITAMRALRPDNLKVLLDNGADHRYISIDYGGRYQLEFAYKYFL